MVRSLLGLHGKITDQLGSVNHIRGTENSDSPRSSLDAKSQPYVRTPSFALVKRQHQPALRLQNYYTKIRDFFFFLRCKPGGTGDSHQFSTCRILAEAKHQESLASLGATLLRHPPSTEAVALASPTDRRLEIR